MSQGQLVTLKFGKNRNQRAEVLKVEGRFVTVRGSFGTVQVLASELSQ